MKTLDILLKTLTQALVSGNKDIEIKGLAINSNLCEDGFLYAALKGTVSNGHQYINQAIANGAVAILHDEDIEPVNGVTYIRVNQVSLVLGDVASAFYNHASESLIIVGCTGTNGKTTVTSLLFDLFTQLGYKCGLISTVEYRIGEEIFPSTHTTPDAISLHRLFNEMLEAGCTHCFMEVSSHAIHQNRISGIQFDAGVFTNITHDHLDYHETFDNYLKVKQQFFSQLSSNAFCVTNRDDRNGMIMVQNTKATKYSYSLHGIADFNAKIIESDFNGMLLRISNRDIWTSLVGKFNASNLLAVYAVAFLLLEGEEGIDVAISALKRVSGRFETIAGPFNKVALIDYAHTPDALENVINTINDIRKKESGLITVVGCGGNRDIQKRPKMGEIAAKLSDRVIFTSDNPRNEDPNAIIDQMYSGVQPQDYKRVLKITDRAEAIKTAILLSQPGDIILIAGKGHETYQEINGVKHDFDDRQITYQFFKTL
jgi:UDP-N-acetylmuramoyl-L-alanyl-D-glutamate--2,6-diaminopimelate ligase